MPQPRALRRLLSTVALLLAPVALAGSSPTADADALIEARHWKRARAVLEPLVARQPSDARAAYLLSRVKAAFGELDAALALAERAATLDARQADYRFQVAEVYGQMALRAGTLRQIGLARRYRKEAERALALDPDHLAAQRSLLVFYWQAPGLVGGDKDKAREAADAIARRDAVEGYLAHAVIASFEKDPARVEALYLKAAAEAPARYDVQMSLATHFAGKKDYPAARRHAETARTLAPGRAAAYTTLAVVHAHTRAWDALDEVLRQAEARVPDNFAAHYQAARVLVSERTDPARAERYLRHYLSTEPEAQSPSLAHAHWRLGLALEQQQRRAEAVAALRKAVQLNPSLEEAKKDLKRLS
jgi:tetratricopeptide (TPR) repeat protein